MTRRFESREYQRLGDTVASSSQKAGGEPPHTKRAAARVVSLWGVENR